MIDSLTVFMEKKEGVKMKVDKNTLELISRLEYIIGSQASNKNTSKGSKGKKGSRFRYTVSYRNNKSDKTLNSIKDELENLSKQQISTIEYVFGTNHLFIGDGILGILDELEKRYDIDFNKLEKERTQKRKESMMKMHRVFLKESELEIDAGRYECELDIKAGKYRITSDEKAVVTILRSDKSKLKDDNITLKNNSEKKIVLEKGDILKTSEMILIKRQSKK